jgi:hypothetical protein
LQRTAKFFGTRLFEAKNAHENRSEVHFNKDAREKYHEIMGGVIDSTLTRDVNLVLEDFPTITAGEGRNYNCDR